MIDRRRSNGARRSVLRGFGLAVALVAAAGCSGTGGSATVTRVSPTAAPTGAATPTATPTPTPTPSPTPSPSSSPGVLTLSTSGLTVTATGATNAQTFTASDPGFTGSFAASTPAAGLTNSCSGIATIAPATGSGAFSVTPQSNGHCIFSITAGPQTASLTVDVTTTTVGGS